MSRATGEQIDKAVSAELPTIPLREEFSGTAKGEAEFDHAVAECDRLTNRIVKSMLHRDCANDPKHKAPCRQKEPLKCEQAYPKDFEAHTQWNEKQIYPRYRRRKPEDGGREMTHTS